MLNGEVAICSNGQGFTDAYMLTTIDIEGKQVSLSIKLDSTDSDGRLLDLMCGQLLLCSGFPVRGNLLGNVTYGKITTLLEHDFDDS